MEAARSVQKVTDMDAPFISVIITAYNRKEYLKEAVKSAINQSLDRSLYEIIVTKNFEDKEIDEFLDSNGVTIFNDNVSGVGPRLINSINQSKGTIISFLEDDDLFYRTKLETVYDKFRCNENLVYYHNSYSNIDDDRRALRRTMLPNPKTPFNFAGNSMSSDQILLLHRLSAAGHNSCISIRKTLIMTAQKFLNEIVGATDAFFFYLAVQSKNEIQVDSSILTAYRIHDSVGVAIKPNFRDFVIKKMTNLEMYLNDSIVLSKAFKSKSLEEIFKCDIKEMELQRALLKLDRRKILRTTFDYIHCLNHRSTNGSKLSLILGVGIISPSAILKIYYIFKLHQISKITSS